MSWKGLGHWESTHADEYIVVLRMKAQNLVFCVSMLGSAAEGGMIAKQQGKEYTKKSQERGIASAVYRPPRWTQACSIGRENC
jgi:hypothetical protein